MTGSFAGAALRLYGAAARGLGWRPQDFWPATPAELAAALAPPEGTPALLDRSELNQLMEHDNGGIWQR
jgi:hypothetical protein